MSIAGVSKASFGFTLFNGLEERGAEILNAKLVSDPLYSRIEEKYLPGPLYNTNYVLTMEHVIAQTSPFVSGEVGYGRYRALQILAGVNAGKGWLPSNPHGALLWSRLTLVERLVAAVLSVCLLSSRAFSLRGRLHNAFLNFLKPYGYVPRPTILDKGSYSRLIQVFEALERDRLKSSAV
jgi:hypothetical protein